MHSVRTPIIHPPTPDTNTHTCTHNAFHHAQAFWSSSLSNSITDDITKGISTWTNYWSDPLGVSARSLHCVCVCVSVHGSLGLSNHMKQVWPKSVQMSIMGIKRAGHAAIKQHLVPDQCECERIWSIFCSSIDRLFLRLPRKLLLSLSSFCSGNRASSVRPRGHHWRPRARSNRL